MDLQDFEYSSMYFNDEMPIEVEHLINQAAEMYGTDMAEELLVQAYSIAPKNLAVIVALYRYYYYQHNYVKALETADMAMTAAGEKLDLPEDWRLISEIHLGAAALVSMGLLRFYLLALKGASYLSLRLNKIDSGLEILIKLTELDPFDRLHVKFLLDMALEKSSVSNNSNIVSIRGYDNFIAAN